MRQIWVRRWGAKLVQRGRGRARCVGIPHFEALLSFECLRVYAMNELINYFGLFGRFLLWFGCVLACLGVALSSNSVPLRRSRLPEVPPTYCLPAIMAHN